MRANLKLVVLLVVVTVGLTGCLGGSGKENETAIKTQLNQLSETFIQELLAKDADALLALFADPMIFGLQEAEMEWYQGDYDDMHAALFMWLAGEDLDPDNEGWMIDYSLEELPTLMEEIQELYAADPDDPKIQELADLISRGYSYGWYAYDAAEGNEEQYIELLKQMQLVDLGIEMPTTVFGAMLGYLTDDDMDITAQVVTAPYQEDGHWYALLELAPGDGYEFEDEDEIESVDLLLRFKKVGANWRIDLFFLIYDFDEAA